MLYIICNISSLSSGCAAHTVDSSVYEDLDELGDLASSVKAKY